MMYKTYKNKNIIVASNALYAIIERDKWHKMGLTPKNHSKIGIRLIYLV